MKILVIAPHPDDEAIGCGGVLCRHAGAGDQIAAVFLTSGELGLKRLPREEAWGIREGEARGAAEILGIGSLTFLRLPDWLVGEDVAAAASALRPVLAQEKPDLIYLPHPEDGHPDHRAALPVLRAALADLDGLAPRLLSYEIWTPLSRHDQVHDITAVMARKLRALRAHRSQLDEFDYVRAVNGLNAFRGALAGKCRYAEVFQSLSPV